MVTQEVTINNEVGLHARPATFFIQKANEFKSGIWVEKDERRVNAKSLLGVLSLGIVKGTTITLLADGADEKEIENKIKNTEYYFKGYETSVRFIDEKEFEKNHKSLAHGGRVIAAADGAKLDFSIALQSNPDFTAKILLRINVPSWLLVKETLIFLSSSSFLCLRRSDNSELLFQTGEVVERGSGVADFPSAELLRSD